MPTTPNLNLVKSDRTTTATTNFNVKTYLDDNWDKVDVFAQEKDTEIGTLTNLTTTDKSSLVGAVNEVRTTANAAQTKADAALPNSANSVTDSNIGNRTADPNTANTYGLTGTITQMFSWILKYFKAITGKANPFDTPTKNLEQLNNEKFDKTGGALTGIAQTNIGTNPSGAAHHIFAATNGSKRFATGLTASETGANTGSDFVIWRYDDYGNFIDEGMRIGRADGRATIPGDFNAGKGYLWNGVLMARTRVNNGVMEYDTTGLGGWRPVGMLRIGASNTVQDDLPTTRSVVNGVMLVAKILPKGIGDLLITGEMATTSVIATRGLAIVRRSTEFVYNPPDNNVDWRTPIGTNLGFVSNFSGWITVNTPLENQAFTAFSETIHTHTNAPLYLILLNDSGGTIQIRNLQIKYDIIG
ncbi:hypothetical protein P9314_03955 [Paenibacillus validus]|uniref:hypothetical protein n=1 Tax=Paenibacillus validus TaxID=44253 RepID=UPI000FD6D225|nr:hypothetical protein [Paenibacillus validus]MED4599861.1 hypothetical protein [Paenibacillus validus]MED4606106.1 hypothetical protein [Paenibacillus validus]